MASDSGLVFPGDPAVLADRIAGLPGVWMRLVRLLSGLVKYVV
jgi:hypothetical protein